MNTQISRIDLNCKISSFGFVIFVVFLTLFFSLKSEDIKAQFQATFSTSTATQTIVAPANVNTIDFQGVVGNVVVNCKVEQQIGNGRAIITITKGTGNRTFYNTGAGPENLTVNVVTKNFPPKFFGMWWIHYQGTAHDETLPLSGPLTIPSHTWEGFLLPNVGYVGVLNGWITPNPPPNNGVLVKWNPKDKSGIFGGQVTSLKGSLNVNLGSQDAVFLPRSASVGAADSGLTMIPRYSTVTTDSQHCVSAFLPNSSVGTQVNFLRKGANPGSGIAFRDNNGFANYCYTGSNPGEDTIIASVSSLRDTVYVTWELPPIPTQPTFNLKVKNFAFGDTLGGHSNVLFFDLFIQHTNAAASGPFELALHQYYFNFNPAIANGGTLSYRIVPGSSQFTNPNMLPRNPAVVGNRLDLIANALQGAGNGQVIDTTIPETRIVKMRLATTSPTFSPVPLSLVYRTLPNGSPYSKIFCYIGSQLTEITNNGGCIIDPFIFGPNFIYIPSQYPNFTSAFNAINNGTHGNGAITVKIDGSFTQTSSATLNGGVFTSLNIAPTTSATVSGNSFDPLILLNGADNVTIDGRIGGDGANNNLTFTNSSSPATNIKLQNGATNNVIRYCNLSLTEFGQNVYIAQSTPGTGGNNDNTIEYCVLSGGLYSLHTTGTAGASGYINARTTFRNNIVKNFRQLGIVLGLETLDNNVTQNEIFNDAAISPYLSAVFCIYNFGVGTSSITKNYIHDMAYGGSNSTQIYGVYSSPSLPTVPGTPTTCTVNVINNIVALGGNNPFTYHGIISSSSGMLYTANLYYNSVRIFGNSDATINQTSSGISQYALTTGSTYNQYNNLVRNDRTGGGPSTIHYGTSRDPFSGTINADYNTIRATDPAKGVNARFGQNYSSIKKYKDAIAKHNVNNNNFNLDNSELHSSFQPAPFISNTDLHINTSGVGGDMNAKPFPSIAADDIDNQMRSSTFPYRGADHIGFSLKLLNLTFALEAITNPPSSTADIIILQLINPATCALVASSTATLPPAPGNTAIFAFGNLIPDGTPYYLRIIHRSSLSLWSATTQSFASGSLTYDFTNASNKAFGVNAMKLVGTEWSMVSGDVNWDAAGLTQDGFIDGSDLLLIDNDAFNSVLGYVDTDLTGDNYVDGSDLALGDNNRNLLEQAPCTFTNPERMELKGEIKSKKVNSIKGQYIK